MARVAVLGGGNGGFAAAAHLTRSGHSVQLWMRSAAAVDAVGAGIKHTGVLGEGKAVPSLVTTHLREAVAGADLVMICLPATAFADLAGRLAGLGPMGAPILLNPGNTGGALAFMRALTDAGGAVPAVAETNTLTYICRKQGDDSVYVSSLVRNVRAGVLPATAKTEVLEVVRDVYPTVRAVDTVLETSLSNVNAVLHPPGIILSAAWIEATGGDFRYYYDAATPGVARVMEALDQERLAIGKAWGVRLEAFPRLFADIGSTSATAGASGSFLQMLLDSEPNRFIKAPPSLDHRYFHEDIPHGIVPMAAFGSAAGVVTPLLDAIVVIASSLTSRDYAREGWTLERLGLRSTLDDAWRRILTGE